MLDSIISYFSEISSIHRMMILVGGLVFFSLIESAVPLMSLNYGRWRHAAVNMFFTLTTIIINFVLAFVLVLASDWTVRAGFGLLQWVDISIWLELILGLLMLDLLGSYAPHWVEHHVQWMWKFHVIHHSDQHLDATSANRHHPGESVIRFVFTIIAAVVIGAPMWLVFLYQSLSLALTQFNHSNFLLPRWVNKVLVMIICTPNMHHVHHHYRMPYSDTNYGNIFSFWDRIFGTYIEVENSKLIYGLDTHMSDVDNKNLASMLKSPFEKYRNHIQYKHPEVLK